MLRNRLFVAAGAAWQDHVEAAITFYSVHVGIAAMAICSIAQRRIAERSAFLCRRSQSKMVSLKPAITGKGGRGQQHWQR